MINIRLLDYGAPSKATIRSLEGRPVTVDPVGRMTVEAMWEINEHLRRHGMRVALETEPDGTCVPPMMIGTEGVVLIEPIPFAKHRRGKE